jgi:tRNA (guanine-N7-)-methyltransferase
VANFLSFAPVARKILEKADSFGSGLVDFGQSRMLQPQQSQVSDFIAEIVPENYFEPLDLKGIYGRSALIEVDLGCGDGAFLADLAARHPERSFLGIERLLGRVRQTGSKIARLKLTNARVLRVETSYAIQHMLPAESVSVFHLMFPDPWPKRRHWPRRVITQDFLSSIHRALAPHGFLRVATDQIDYFQEIERLAARSPEFDRVTDQETPGVVSTFEKRFRESGVEIHCLALQKISRVI